MIARYAATLTPRTRKSAHVPGSFAATPFASASDGLRHVLRHLPTSSGRPARVIVPAYTCARVVSAVLASGATPEFVDIDPASGAFEVLGLEAAMASGVDAVLLTHLFGLAPDRLRVQQLAARHQVCVIEDAALVVGASLLMPHQSQWTLFSLGRGKPVSLGAGGVILGRLPECAFPSRSREPAGEEAIGYLGLWRRSVLNSQCLDQAIAGVRRLGTRGAPEPAAVGGAAGSEDQVGLQLTPRAAAAVLTAFSAQNVQRAVDSCEAALACYREAFSSGDAALAVEIGQRVPPGHAVPALAVMVEQRRDARDALWRAGVHCPLYWPYSVAAQAGRMEFSGSTRLADSLLFLPLHSQVTAATAARVAAVLKPFQPQAFA